MNNDKLNQTQMDDERRSKKRVPLTRATFLAIMSMLMTVAVAASLTFALFVGEVKDQHVRIQAGDLEIGVDYVKLEGRKVDVVETSPTFGRLVDFTSDATNNTEGVDFGRLKPEARDNIFLIENAAPGLHETATFEIYNEGSIAFYYTFEIQKLEKAGGTDDQYNALIKQIQIEITDGVTTEKFILADHAGKQFKSQILNPTPSGATAVPGIVTVKATFLDDQVSGNGLTKGDNMLAQNGGCTFDILIVATQTT